MKAKWGLLKMSHSDPLAMVLQGRTDTLRLGPAASLSGVLDGTVQYGMVSLISYVEHRADLAMLDGPVIAFSGQTLSTLLVSDSSAHGKRMRIAISADTRTTQWYLEKVLQSMHLEHSFVETDKIEVEDLLGEAPYALVIGDEALKVFSTTHRILFDVGFEFQRAYGLDPLYAVSVSRTIDGTEKNDWYLEASRYFGICAKDVSERLGVSEVTVSRYFQKLRYSPDRRSASTLLFVTERMKNDKRKTEVAH